MYAFKTKNSLASSLIFLMWLLLVELGAWTILLLFFVMVLLRLPVSFRTLLKREIKAAVCSKEGAILYPNLKSWFWKIKNKQKSSSVRLIGEGEGNLSPPLTATIFSLFAASSSAAWLSLIFFLSTPFMLLTLKCRLFFLLFRMFFSVLLWSALKKNFFNLESNKSDQPQFLSFRTRWLEAIAKWIAGLFYLEVRTWFNNSWDSWTIWLEDLAIY